MEIKKTDQDQATEESRRNFLKKAGKLAVYTPPALMVMMHPSRKAMACSWGKGGWQPSQGGQLQPPKIGDFKFPKRH